jgi:dCMP deaminase
MLGLAEYIAREWSKDPSTQVGAVIASPCHREVHFGYNGFPQGVEDTPERLNNREMRLKMTIHAEVNAVINSKGGIKGHTLFTWPFFPCAQCATVIIQAGIARVIAPAGEVERWAEDHEIARVMFGEAGVEYWTITQSVQALPPAARQM